MSSSSEPRQKLRVASLQPALGGGQEEPNLRRVREAVERVAGEGPLDLVVLPECFNGVFDDEAGQVSARADRFLSELARRFRVCVVGGSVERRAADGSLFNSTSVFDEAGACLGTYDKRVLFGREAGRRRPGTGGPGVFVLGGWRVGVLICADLWYPEMARQVSAEVDLFCVPAETVVPGEDYVAYGRTLWFNLAFTRAEENAVPVVVSDWARTRLGPGQSPVSADGDGDHFTCGGGSIVDPSARPDLDRIQYKLADGRAGVLSATLELKRLREFRAYRRSVGLLEGDVAP